MTAITRLVSALVLALALCTGPVLAATDSDDASAAKKNPDYAQAVKMVKAGDFSGAIPLLNKSLQTDPANPGAYNYLGYSHRKLGDREKALVFYTKALEIKPRHLGANEYLGELYLEQGELNKAEERLAVLDKACFFGCDEYYELKESIETYRKQTAQ